jgi:hypothetical protein
MAHGDTALGRHPRLELVARGVAGDESSAVGMTGYDDGLKVGAELSATDAFE